eukprot:COSAG06_NODE_21563_length_753_cov_0.677370_3_plen_92_part_01
MVPTASATSTATIACLTLQLPLPTGWCQKFKCGGIESMDNIKLMVDLGGKFDVGCVTGAAGTPTGAAAVFAPNVWRNDVMVPLSLTENFFYR